MIHWSVDLFSFYFFGLICLVSLTCVIFWTLLDGYWGLSMSLHVQLDQCMGTSHEYPCPDATGEFSGFYMFISLLLVFIDFLWFFGLFCSINGFYKVGNCNWNSWFLLKNNRGSYQQSSGLYICFVFLFRRWFINSFSPFTSGLLQDWSYKYVCVVSSFICKLIIGLWLWLWRLISWKGEDDDSMRLVTCTTCRINYCYYYFIGNQTFW